MTRAQKALFASATNALFVLLPGLQDVLTLIPDNANTPINWIPIYKKCAIVALAAVGVFMRTMNAYYAPPPPPDEPGDTLPLGTKGNPVQSEIVNTPQNPAQTHEAGT